VNVETIEVDLALRTPEEGSDLGLQLFRRHARRTLLAGAIVMAPIWALALALVEVHWSLAFLALWWTKPILDRVALFVLSRAVFGAPPTIRQTLAAAPGFFDRRLLAGLTYKRFIPRRSLYLPVAVLEGLRGPALRERFRLVSRHGAARVSLVQTVGWLHVEWTLWGGLAWLIALFLPEGLVPPMLELMFGGAAGTAALLWLHLLTLMPVMLVSECAYVASGLGLYLSRRTELEGWDIQLAFERMGARIAARARGGIAVALLGAALLLALGAPAEAAYAGRGGAQPVQAEAAAQEAAAEAPRDVAAGILATDEFDRTRTVTTWEPTWGGGSGGESSLGPALATLLKFLGWAALAALLLAVVVAIARRAEAREGAVEETEAPRPTEAFGLDLREESLPADVASEARRLVDAGELQAALSLLYRGALVRLVDDHGLPIETGDTEHDCMDRVAGRLAAREPALVAAFRALTRTWLEAAWAGAPVEAAAVLDHCDAYARSFGARRGRAA